MKTRIPSLLLALVLIAGLFAACNSSSSSSSSDGGTTAATDEGTSTDTGSTDGGSDSAGSTADYGDAVNLDGTLPIVTDPSALDTMTMAIVVPPERILASRELAMIQKLEAETGVIFDWQEIPSDGATEKINLMLSAYDLPDAFWNNISGTIVAQYMDQEIFLPTEDLVDQYMPRLKAIYDSHPDYRKGATAPDGHTYGFPYIEEMRGLVLTPGPFIINKNWLDQVGMDLPTTTDEFVEVLKAFRDAGDLNGNGVDDEIPYALDFTNKDTFGSYNTFHQFTGAFGQADSYCNGNYTADHMRVIDGQIVFTAMDEAYRETAKFFRTMYEENLIDPDSFSPGASEGNPLYLNKITGEDAVVGVMGLWAPSNQITNVDVRTEYVALPRMDGPNGKTGVALNFSEMQDTSMVAITTDCKYPEIIAAFVDYCFEPEISITLNWGAEEWIYIKGDDGVLHFDLDENDNIVLKENFQTFGELRNNSTPTRGALAVLDAYYDTIVDYTWDAIDLLQFQTESGKYDILDEYTTVPKMILTSEEQTRISQLQSTISDTVTRYTMQWILDGNVDETWDNYLSELEAAGVNDLVAVFQQAYDRFQAA